MDSELQKAIRDFRPEDPMTHGLWQKLMRVQPLKDVLATVPYDQVSTKGLFLVIHKALEEVAKRIRAQKTVRVGKAEVVLREEKQILIEAESGYSQQHVSEFWESLSRAMKDLHDFVKEDMACHMSLSLGGSASDDNYFGSTIHRADITLHTTIFRPETEEETQERHRKEEAAREAKKVARRESAKKKKLEDEQRELAELERLKKKYEKKLKN